MTGKRILIDGYNLGMATGTGIATYARGLAATATCLGHEVDLLYGPATLAINEKRRTNASARAPAQPWSRVPIALWRGLRQISRLGRSVRVEEIPSNAVGVLGLLTQAPPPHDRLYAAPSLFEVAHIYYWATGRFLEITAPTKPDIVHWTYTLPMRVLGAKNVYTIHDLVPFILPGAVRMNRGRFHALTKQIVREADHIVTVSEHSRQDIIRLFDAPAERITNTYQSVELPAEGVKRAIDDVRAEVERAYGLPFGEYFLYFGAIEPKKNVARLIQAYLRSGIESPLVIVGKLAWDCAAEKKLLRDDLLRFPAPGGSGPQARRGLKHIDYMPRDSLVALIRGAKAVAFPSLYEGFGLPAIEAMLLGAPVLASTGGSLPEVCGEAALLIGPHDVEALSAGLRRLDEDRGLRQSLSEKGRLQAARFSQAAYADRLAQLYRSLLD